jgi:hypothetical protein
MKYITPQTYKTKFNFYKLQQKEQIKLKIVIVYLTENSYFYYNL